MSLFFYSLLQIRFALLLRKLFVTVYFYIGHVCFLGVRMIHWESNLCSFFDSFINVRWNSIF